ncbi:UDP-N-acetylglucosamine 4,6-dehydratase (inverting) [Streptacidiphilus sp. PAMC 29251]
MTSIDRSSVLVTGGTGSFGKAFVGRLLESCDPERVIIYSRDELKQLEARRLFNDDPRLEWVIGDIRDRHRLARALHGVEYVVHAAALKQVDTAERHPSEFVSTNILGSQNVIEAALDAGVAKVVALSTDKACKPVNLYGATKLIADKSFVSANLAGAKLGTAFSVIRYGNVLGSRGSVVPLFREIARKGGSIPVTDKRMTRFWITLDHAVDFVLGSFDLMQGGEIFVPRIPSMRVIDLAEAVAPASATHEVGVRPGEKLHEDLICSDDAPQVLRLADRFIVRSPILDAYQPPVGAEPVGEEFAYRSDLNDQWLDVEDLRDLLETL